MASDLRFRALTKDDVECRIGSCTENGCSLLLYKNARVDMALLDETVGPLNWQRSHSRENANCTVSIYDAERGIWVSKEDTGTESNTEAAKGLASDSFKRACFNWGIGRELYTAPFIWFPASKLAKFKATGNRFQCRDSFTVDEMEVKDGRIVSLVVADEDSGEVFSWRASNAKKVRTKAARKKEEAAAQEQQAPVQQPAQQQQASAQDALDRAKYDYFLALAEFCARTGKVQERVHAGYENVGRSNGLGASSDEWSAETWGRFAAAMMGAKGNA